MRSSAPIQPTSFLIAASANAVSPAHAACPASHRTPNVLIIVADGLGYVEIGAYGATRIKTPNIDALAYSGLLSTHAYASANACSPSRAGLVTGRHAIRSGLAWKVINAKDERGLARSEETIAEAAWRAKDHTTCIDRTFGDERQDRFWHAVQLQIDDGGHDP